MTSPLQLISSSPGHPAWKWQFQTNDRLYSIPCKDAQKRRNKNMENPQGPSGLPYITFIPFARPAVYTQGLQTTAWAGGTASPSKRLCETLFSQKHNQPPTTHPGLAAEGSYILSSPLQDLGETLRKKILLSQLATSYLSQRVGDNTASYTQAAFSFGARARFRHSL